MIRSRDSEWLQGAVNALVGLFIGVILMVNVAKSKTMNFQPGLIHMEMS